MESKISGQNIASAKKSIDIHTYMNSILITISWPPVVRETAMETLLNKAYGANFLLQYFDRTAVKLDRVNIGLQNPNCLVNAEVLDAKIKKD